MHVLSIWMIGLLLLQSTADAAAHPVGSTHTAQAAAAAAAAVLPLQFEFTKGAVAKLGVEVLQRAVEVSRFAGDVLELATALQEEPDLVGRQTSSTLAVHLLGLQLQYRDNACWCA
jgi:hypothetical protein